MFIEVLFKKVARFRLSLMFCLFFAVLILPQLSSDSCAQTGQKNFASADEAVKGFVAAVRAGNEK